MAKKSRYQDEYNKQVKRLKSAIKRYEKEGLIFPDDILPNRPKRITQASVNKLKKIKPKDLIKKAEFLDVETGELFPPSERKKYSVKYEEPQSQNYVAFPSEEDIIISNFRTDIIGRFPEGAGPVLNRWLNNLLADHSKTSVAMMLEEAAANGIYIDYSVAYSNDLLLSRIGDMMEFLDGINDIEKAMLLDSLEAEEDWESPE